MTGGKALAGALLVTLATPATWPLALGTFLLRGGIMLVAVPIVVLPTPVGIANVLAPALSSIAFGTIPLELALVVGAICVAVVLWLIAGGWLAALLEAEAARIVASDEDVVALRGPIDAGGTRGRVAGRILVARLAASVPLAVTLAIGSVRLVFVTYRELTNPLDAMPILVRVLRAAPEVVVAVGLAWLVAEIIGATAARSVALDGMGVSRALRHAAVTSVRHPLSALVRFTWPTIALLVVLVPAALAATSTWAVVGSVLEGGSDPLEILVAVVGFVALWTVGLLLMSVVCAWRAAVWTVGRVTPEGTFGGYSDRRPGHWQPDHPSATL